MSLFSRLKTTAPAAGFAVMALAAPLLRAQISSVRIASVPPGPTFQVDGQSYQGAVMMAWPASSQHSVNVGSPVQTLNDTQYSFSGWSSNITDLPYSNFTVDSTLNWIQANFSVTYKLRLMGFPCDTPSPACAQITAGHVMVNDVPYSVNSDIWLPEGVAVRLQALPNPGYIFVGWQPIAGVSMVNSWKTGFTLNAPVTVAPIFAFAVPVSVGFSTVPNGLQLVVDSAAISSGWSAQWGITTQHQLGAPPTQRDQQGQWWVFQSWSDGGPINHTYTVPVTETPISLSAQFVAGATYTFQTSPPGLKLTVDGRDNWPSYNFIWAAGTSHAVLAPAQQTDPQGNRYQFVSWSNGGSANQTVSVATAPDNQRFTAVYQAISQMVLGSTAPGVILQVDGNDCATPCTLTRAVGTSVHVTAPVNLPNGDGSRLDFQSWSDGGAADRTLTATSGTLNLTAAYQVMNRLGTVSAPPDGAAWRLLPGSPDGYYPARSQVSVSASGRPGWRFLRFTGDLSGSGSSGLLDMSQPRQVRAVLDAVPYLSDSALHNAAGDPPAGTVAPGSIVSLYGVNLAPSTVVGSASPLAQTLAGVVAQIGDQMLPLYFVSPSQVNLQLPSNLPAGSGQLSLQWGDKPAVTATFTVARNAPGVFTQNLGGQVYAVATHEDGTSVTPDAPAGHGEVLTLYATGLGPYDHPALDGFAVPAGAVFNVLDPVQVVVGGEALTPDFAGAATGSVGLSLVQFRLPSDASTGAPDLHLVVNGIESNHAALAVQ